MSSIQRYESYGRMEECSDGFWVPHRDHEEIVTRLESRLAAAEKLRDDVASVIRRQPAHNNEVGFFVIHLEEDGAEHIEQVDPAAVLACTVGCLTAAIADFDAAKETA